MKIVSNIVLLESGPKILYMSYKMNKTKSGKKPKIVSMVNYWSLLIYLSLFSAKTFCLSATSLLDMPILLFIRRARATAYTPP